MDSIYDRFLNYLNDCQGCIGPRKTVDCSFRGVCATAESLAVKGLVKDADELKVYGSYQLPSRRRRRDFEYPRRVR